MVLARLSSLADLFLLLYELAENTYRVASVFFEIKVEAFGEPNLEKVVIERLLGEANSLGGFLEAESDQV